MTHLRRRTKPAGATSSQQPDPAAGRAGASGRVQRNWQENPSPESVYAAVGEAERQAAYFKALLWHKTAEFEKANTRIVELKLAHAASVEESCAALEIAHARIAELERAHRDLSVRFT